jgi:uncharacterized protein (TIGR02246 family)
MNVDDQQAASRIVAELERAWNAADGAGFGRPFRDDADFVNIRGEHFRTREIIARGHQAIFDTIYKGSTVRLEIMQTRALAPDVSLAHVRSSLNAPTGPLAGDHVSLMTIVLTRQAGEWEIAALHNTLVVPR